jgi:putative hydrolase of the HAD superfamily
MDRPPRPPKFLYFDLGNVLMFFDHHRACRQLAACSGCDETKLWELIFSSGLELKYEAGTLSSQQVYNEFLKAAPSQVDFDCFAQAASDIFEVNVPVKAILTQLLFSNHRLGLLSNTNEIHWRLLTDGRYSLIPDAFEQLVLSFEVGAVKPEPAIFQAAIVRAGVAAHEIFYVDDIPGHVAAARAAGLDAVPYTSAPALAAALRERGVEFNY